VRMELRELVFEPIMGSVAGPLFNGPYVISAPGGALAPGAEANYWWGPWPYEHDTIVVSATPLAKAGEDRAVAVTRVSMEVKPDGSRYFYARIKNLGSTPVDFSVCAGGWWRS
jgi:hypothetical protein